MTKSLSKIKFNNCCKWLNGLVVEQSRVQRCDLGSKPLLLPIFFYLIQPFWRIGLSKIKCYTLIQTNWWYVGESRLPSSAAVLVRNFESPRNFFFCYKFRVHMLWQFLSNIKCLTWCKQSDGAVVEQAEVQPCHQGSNALGGLIFCPSFFLFF